MAKESAMNAQDYAQYMALIGDASPHSETHWSRCRFGQRRYARNILAKYEAGQRQRRGEIKHSIGVIMLVTLFIILLAMVFAGGC